MSAGNGEDRDAHVFIGGAFSAAQGPSTWQVTGGETFQNARATAQLSARERSEQMDALIAQVETLTREHNAIVKAVDGIMWRVKALESVTVDEITADLKRETYDRLDAIERGAALLSAWVRRPFWERVRSRLGF